MSLSILSPLPDPVKAMNELRRENERLREELREAQQEASELRREAAGKEKGVRELRTVLTPLYQALAHIFGVTDEMGVGAEEAAGSPKKSAVWESWKEKLGGKTGEAIDALLLHGEMSAQQLRIHLKCGNEYVYKVITKLANANLINRREGRVSLKEL
jgi:hypothetical protein